MARFTGSRKMSVLALACSSARAFAPGARGAFGRSVVRSIAVGDSVPAVPMISAFPDESCDMVARLAGKKVVLVGLPGAFTPT